ncbi:MAG TPA: hypothetical protein VIR03_03125 [Candidatus Saccharimonadales bacterium]
MKFRRELAFIGLSLITLFVWLGPVAYAQSSSAHYQVNESFFGTGGELSATSPNYQAKQSAGELTVGNPASANYQFRAGFNTSDTPLLEFAVNGGTYDMGVLGPGITGSAVASFTVRSYLSSGYVVVLNGTPPTETTHGHTLAAMSSATTSSPGTEQFGVNLVANTNPTVGSNPGQVPDGSYSFGTPLAGYDTANNFKFVDGDTIAMSSKSSGQTNYALSMIANVTQSTPDGQYGGALQLQVIPTF